MLTRLGCKSFIEGSVSKKNLYLEPWVQVSKVARSIRTKLEELDKANLVSRKNPGTEAGTPTDRTRMAITSTLRKKLKDLMGEFQSLRQRVMGEYRDTIERRYGSI